MAQRWQELKLVDASYFNATHFVRELLAAGVDVDATDFDGMTGLLYAAERGHSCILGLLIAAGANTEARDYAGETSLALAARRNDADCVHALLSAGADASARSETGSTPLHRAVTSGGTAAAFALLAGGADMDAHLYGTGYAPLHLCIREFAYPGESAEDISGRIACAAMLVSFGADPTPHPRNAGERVPPPVADAARACLAAMQPEAVAAAIAEGVKPMSIDAPVPRVVTALIRAHAASLRAAQDLADLGDPVSRIRSAENVRGLFGKRRKLAATRWGQPELMAILAVARGVSLASAAAEARAQVATASAALDVARERLQQFVTARLGRGDDNVE